MADDPTADTVVQSYFTYYQAMIDFINGRMTGSDTATVVGLSAACPLNNGDVVYQARTMYDIIFDTPAVFNFDCDPQKGKKGSRSATTGHTAPTGSVQTLQQSYSIVPNPNAGDFTLRQTVPDNLPIRLAIYNMTGQVVSSNETSFENQACPVAMVNPVPGIYLARITTAKGETFTLKFTVR